jgi:hypothetical protein
MPDIPVLSRLASQALQHVKFANLFLREPLANNSSVGKQEERLKESNVFFTIG